ncbi:MAG: response regulator [Kofleriaceae bacterium]
MPPPHAHNPGRDRRLANDHVCMAALRDVQAVLDRHRLDREVDETAFAVVIGSMRTLLDALVDVDATAAAGLAGLLDELGADPTRVVAWHRFEDLVEHWFVLVRHVVFGLRPEVVPGELVRLRDELDRVLRPAPASVPVLAVAAPARATVLLIDDSAVVLAVVEAALEAAGYRVATAASFSVAEQILRKLKPDLVLTDVCLPDVEGDDVCARLKQRAGHLVPVVLMSNLPEVELARRAAAAKADAFLSKRHGPQHVVDVVDALLDELIL